MDSIKKYINRYFTGFRRLNVWWKAGVACSLFGLVWLVLGVWLTPSVQINSARATQQRNAAVALIAIGLLLRFVGAVVHTKRNLIQRKRR